MRIVISSSSLRGDVITAKLEHIEDLQLRASKLKEANITPYRTIEPTVVVAIVSTTGVALGALITGLLGLASQAHGKKIVIQTQRGTRIEVPINCPKEKVQEYIDLLKDLETARIEL
jgi:hypothetical protein